LMAGIKGVRSFVAVVLRKKVCTYVKTQTSLKSGDFMVCILKDALLLESKWAECVEVAALHCDGHKHNTAERNSATTETNKNCRGKKKDILGGWEVSGSNTVGVIITRYTT
jgi:hypothetical protein